MSDSIGDNVGWTPVLEEYFASTAEKAHCLSWSHKQAEAFYSKRKTFIDLPVIVLSSLVGFLSVGSSTMFEGHETTASVALGVVSLIVSILNTTGSYFQWSKRAEGHRISAIQYGKLYRFLSIEMSLPREERMTPPELLKSTREAYDRLQEVSPLIPSEVVAMFQQKFKTEKDISKPEEMNGLEKVVVYTEIPTPKKMSRNSSDEVLSPAPIRTEPESVSSP